MNGAGNAGPGSATSGSASPPRAEPSVRDVVTMSMLPSQWTGAAPAHIGESLASALDRVLGPDLVCVGLVGGVGENPIVHRCAGRCPVDPALSERVEAAAKAWIERGCPEDAIQIDAGTDARTDDGTDAGPERSLRVAVRVVGEGAELGYIATAFADPARPSPADHTLLDIAASQAAVAVRNALLLIRVRQGEERMSFVRRTSGVGYWYCDLPFDVLEWDEHVKAHFHLEPDAVVTIETFFDRIHPGDRERTRLAMARSIDRHDPYDIDYRTVHPETGEIKWIRAIGRTDYAPDGTPTRFDGVTLDVTERHRALDHAAAAAARLTLVADAMPALISYVDAEERYQFNNAAYEGWFGHDREELRGRSLREVLGEEAYQLVAPHVRKALSGQRTGFETELPYQTGGPRLVMAEYVPDTRSDGSVAGFYALVTDITQRRQHEKARARLAAIVQSSGDAIVSKTLDGVIETWNEGASRIFGHTAEEAIGRPVSMLIPEDRLDEEDRIVGSIREGRSIEPYETVRRRKDGSLVDVSLRVSPVLDGEGRIVGASKIARDITERKQFEQALRESEERFKSMANAAPAMLWVTAPDGGAIFLSRGWFEYTGQTEEEAAGFGWVSAVYPDDRERSGRAFMDANEKREAFWFDYRLRRADGAYRWCIDSGKPSFDESGVFQGFVGSVIDVHERKMAETAQRESEERFRGLFVSMDQGYCVAEMAFDDAGRAVDYRLIEMNPAFEKHTGQRELLGKSIRESLPDLEEFWFETYGRVAKTGEPVRFVHQAQPMGRRWFDVYAFRLGGPGSNKVAMLFTDISDRKQAEEALRESEERFRAMADNISQFAWMADATGSIFWYNRRWYDYTGTTLEQMAGWGWQAVQHPDHVDRVTDKFKRHIDGGVPWEDIFPLRGTDGGYRWFLSRAQPIFDAEGRILRWFGTNTDITEHREIEQELARHKTNLEQLVVERTRELAESHERLRLSERMASLGTLSAGLGHDMGNLLVPVRVCVESLEDAGLPPELASHVSEIKTSADYLQQLANGLRLMAIDPDRSRTPQPTELGRWWSDASPVMRAALPRSVELRAEFSDDCWASIAKAALTQTVFNLVQNAGSAMRGEGPGVVRVAANTEGDRVVLTVEDTGPGMTPEVRARCMEPFFTTKTRGISTGLGLVLVAGLVRDAKGTVDLWSEPGVGTRFTITLPRAEPSEIPEAPSAQGRRASVGLSDPRLRAFVTAELRSLAFEVVDDAERDGVIDLAVVQPEHPAADTAKRVLVVGDHPDGDGDGDDGLRAMARPSAIKEALRKVSRELSGGGAPP